MQRFLTAIHGWKETRFSCLDVKVPRHTNDLCNMIDVTATIRFNIY